MCVCKCARVAESVHTGQVKSQGGVWIVVVVRIGRVCRLDCNG